MGWLDARAEIDSLNGWWADAGVDVAIDETPRNWLAEGKPKPGPTGRPVSEAAEPAPAPSPLPTTHAAFIDWWMNDTSTLSAFPQRRRVAPAGSPGVALMAIADMPEASDVDQGRLLSGEAGALFDKMLVAMGVHRDAIYLATVAPARTPGGLLDEKSTDALTPIVRHHVALAAPEKLWLLGNAASRAMLGMDLGAAGGRLHCVNQDGRTIAAIATLHPAVLVKRPNLKGAVWEDMKRLNGERA